jgi:hypothetical protein
MKEELNKYVGNLRKKNQTEILEIKISFNHIKNTVEGHSIRLKQVEDRLLGLKDKIDIKERNKELLVKQLKSCERNMQELTNSTKRPNLRIVDIKEEMQARGIHNIVNETIAENFPNLEKKLSIQVQEAGRTLNRLDQNRTLHSILLLKQLAQRTEKEY